MVSVDDVKKLRSKMGVPIKKAKEALEEAGGDQEKALEILRKSGAKVMAKRDDKETTEGIIAHYVHFNGKMAALVKLHSETDFVAKNEDFKQLAEDLAMQIAAMNPETKEDLMAQPSMKNEEITVDDAVNEVVSKLGEKIVVGEFTRFKL